MKPEPQGATSTTQSLLETEGSETLTLQLRAALLARHLLLVSYAFLLLHTCVVTVLFLFVYFGGFEAIVCDSPPSSR